MGAPPRRKAKPGRPGPRNWMTAARCGACGKVAHPSRSAAKKAMRKWHAGEVSAVNVYTCRYAEHEVWHIGHKIGAKQ